MDISTVNTPEELAAIKALRYSVNKDELGKDFLFQTEDTGDQNALILYAKREDLIIGSLRCSFTFFHDGIKTYWGIKKPDFNSKVALVDRLVVHPAYRKTRVTYDLTTAIYKNALLEGAHMALIETEEHLVKMYNKIGFQVYREIKHDYGLRFQMFINPWDSAYLNSINSPFFKEYLAYIQFVNSFALADFSGNTSKTKNQNTPNGVLPVP